MNKLKLDKADEKLVKIAHKEFQKRTSHDWHGVSCAIRLKSGKVESGVVLEAEVPSLTVCAEPITIGKVLHDLPEDPIDCIVATRSYEKTDHKVIPPCGRCREFITDYGPDSKVIIFDEKDDCLYKVVANDLLPYKYKGNSE